MTIWAIVPVKPLRRGKSRLAGTLSEDEREKLNTQLLERTLTTLNGLSEIAHTLVVSRDPAALSMARDLGARTVLEDGTPHLNTAMARAAVVARVHATRGVLFLPSDLPLLTKEDILTIISAGNNPPVVVISPDRREDGTNALLVSPAGLIDYEFGPGSFKRHCQSALNMGARLEVVSLPSVGLDLDLPEDLALLQEIEKTRPKP